VDEWYTCEYDEENRLLRRYDYVYYDTRPEWYENIYDEGGRCVLRIYYDRDGKETARVENPEVNLMKLK